MNFLCVGSGMAQDPYSPGLPPCPQPIENPDDCGCPPIEDMSEDVNPDKNCCTKCTGDTKCNIWFTLRAPGFPGRCILDELTYDEVYDVLRRNPDAAKDLMRITNDPKLLSLAREVELVMTAQEEAEKAAKRLNANSLPFYTVLRGNGDGTVR